MLSETRNPFLIQDPEWDDGKWDKQTKHTCMTIIAILQKLEANLMIHIIYPNLQYYVIDLQFNYDLNGIFRAHFCWHKAPLSAQYNSLD